MLIFHSFTWQQFLITALVLTVAWYAVVWFLYFRRKQGVSQQKPVADEPETSLMGAAKPVNGLSGLSTEDFVFHRMGVIPDILEELKSIFFILDRDSGGKAEFISLFSLVGAKYPQIKGSPDQDALNDYIRENLPFEITEKELEELWP
ncbi:MAG TPA: hypothetical protein VIM55_10425 [Mucilaginibacter sp.]